ncbi:hypothetical protein OKA04_16700 [Luteolibacter flavescens]|uniref:Uncharacterized protein n=1 Tax=Luteolibacter flavescens TaxID=1859460 RepID=A0ABT3FSU7_9BACT|nr:hypothetical protein [Luteolibacter flavescens]MCW1886379.1 hypothetical protein [Luteolibacter flavescens]
MAAGGFIFDGEVVIGALFLVVVGIAISPILRPGGILGCLKLSVAIASGIAGLAGVSLLADFVYLASTRGGEGPRGEGSPMQGIAAMMFVALLFFCPWLITALRGIAAIRDQPSDSQMP